MKTTEYISSRILKYQNPPNGIQRRDAIADYRPAIPLGVGTLNNKEENK